MKALWTRVRFPASPPKYIGLGHARENAERLLAVNVPIKVNQCVSVGMTRFRHGEIMKEATQ